MDKVDLIGGACLLIFGILLIFVVIPLGTEEGMYFGLAPTFFPTLLATGMTLCAAAMTIQAWLRLRARPDPGPMPISKWNLLMFLASAALVIAGVVVIDLFGIFIGGPVLIAAFMLLLGERSPLRVALTATLPVVTVYLLATYVLRAPLP